MVEKKQCKQCMHCIMNPDWRPEHKNPIRNPKYALQYICATEEEGENSVDINGDACEKFTTLAIEKEKSIEKKITDKGW